MEILDLPLKKQWYQMIESGIKKEEYREIKPYWEKRLLDYKGISHDLQYLACCKVFNIPKNVCKEYPRGYDAVRFR